VLFSAGEPELRLVDRKGGGENSWLNMCEVVRNGREIKGTSLVVLHFAWGEQVSRPKQG